MPPGLLGPIPKCAWPEGGPYGGRSPPPSWDRRRRPAPWAGGHRTRTARSRTGASSERASLPWMLVNTSSSRSMQSRIRRSSTSSAPTPARVRTSGPGAPQPRPRPAARRSTAPRRRRGPARRPPRPRHTDARSCDSPPPAHPPCAAPARPAQLPESRSPPPPETPLDSSRSLDLNGSVAVAPRHHGVRHAGGPTTGNPGGPMKVARNGSDRSHDGGRRHDRGNGPGSVREGQSPR